MQKQIIFLIVLLLTLGVFTYTSIRIARFFRLTKPAFRVRNTGKRISETMKVAFGQSKMFRLPVVGTMHALVFWGFCVILIGSVEMIIDGLAGTERVLKVLGVVYDIIIASGDIFALVVAVFIIAFLVRRLFLHIQRFEGSEMKRASHIDANIALTLILLLMLSLLGMNTAYYASVEVKGAELAGIYPVSSLIAPVYADSSPETIHLQHEIYWWLHIVLIFIFANILPYSKHFHVFMSIPNVFLSRLWPLGKMINMDNITREVKMMMDPETAFSEATDEAPIERFGVKDIEDITWKNYLDSLSCTQCGRCTAVCPANITGKKLSPRKIIMDMRSRMNDKGPGLVRNGSEYNDSKSLLNDYISKEELWACTTCNACAKECPININHPEVILGMRRYMVMEEGDAPGEVKAVFNNIENNGAPWQYSSEDRLLWADNIEVSINEQE
ncbi:MAG: 4Fe-4S dicluster domain-containing protein [Bacteroidales bacterium]|nr:4Fe-4S dicluster domain-containing protein [Bacteroidales bacterium]